MNAKTPIRQGESMAWRVGISAFIFFLTLIVFVQARHFDFINYDDGIFVAENPHVLGGLTPHAIGWAWTTVYVSYWQPITWMSHMLDVSLYGLNPGGHHLTSVIIHAINGVLVFLALTSLTRATWKSAIVAALFAWHPLRVESVAWISEPQGCFVRAVLSADDLGIWQIRARRWGAVVCRVHRAVLPGDCL